MCGLSQCNLKSFLDDTGTLLVLGRRFLGERHHMLRFRAPGQHIHIVWLLHCIAASYGLALISFQYNAGKSRRKHACKKICCLHWHHHTRNRKGGMRSKHHIGSRKPVDLKLNQLPELLVIGEMPANFFSSARLVVLI